MLGISGMWVKEDAPAEVISKYTISIVIANDRRECGNLVEVVRELIREIATSPAPRFGLSQ